MTAETNSSRDIVLWILFALILGAGIYGFIYFDNQVMDLVRIVGLLVVIGIACAVAFRTLHGRQLFDYFREADIERRKVVWPTRQETTQTTLIVIAVTIVIGIMLFIMDTIFGFLVRRLIGIGGGL
ncbi:MAG: preprotein translocase subunit SecE [Pseudomonadota bacterium]